MYYYRANYADAMWKQFNPEVINFDDLDDKQIFDFDKGQKYLIS